MAQCLQSPGLILMLVFGTLRPKYNSDCLDTKDLLAWMLVAKAWHYEGIRILYQHVHMVAQNDLQIRSKPDLLPLSDAHRDIAASFVRDLRLGTDGQTVEEPSTTEIQAFRATFNDLEMNLHHLKIRSSIRMQYLQPTLTRACLLKLFGFKLQSIILQGQKIEMELLHFVKNNTQYLSVLHLQFIEPLEPDIKDMLLETVEQKTTLKEIRLRTTREPSATILEIFNCLSLHPSLETIYDLDPPEDLRQLPQNPVFFPVLKDLSFVPDHELRMALTERLESITRLTLRGTFLGWKLLMALGFGWDEPALPNLRHLDIDFDKGMKMDAEELTNTLLALPSLQTLTLTFRGSRFCPTSRFGIVRELKDLVEAGFGMQWSKLEKIEVDLIFYSHTLQAKRRSNTRFLKEGGSFVILEDTTNA